MTKNTNTAPARPELHAQKWTLLYQHKVHIGFPGKTTQKNPQGRTISEPFPSPFNATF